MEEKDGLLARSYGREGYECNAMGFIICKVLPQR